MNTLSWATEAQHPPNNTWHRNTEICLTTEINRRDWFSQEWTSLGRASGDSIFPACTAAFGGPASSLYAWTSFEAFARVAATSCHVSTGHLSQPFPNLQHLATSPWQSDTKCTWTYRQWIIRLIRLFCRKKLVIQKSPEMTWKEPAFDEQSQCHLIVLDAGRINQQPKMTKGPVAIAKLVILIRSMIIKLHLTVVGRYSEIHLSITVLGGHDLQYQSVSLHLRLLASNMLGLLCQGTGHAGRWISCRLKSWTTPFPKIVVNFPSNFYACTSSLA